MINWKEISFLWIIVSETKFLEPPSVLILSEAELDLGSKIFDYVMNFYKSGNSFNFIEKKYFRNFEISIQFYTTKID